VHNYCRNRVSKIIRKREGKESYEKHAIETQPDVEELPKETLLSEQVNEAMGKMKDAEREILVMKFTTGLTIQEISEAMDIGLSAAKMRLYRAMDSFKEFYAQSQTPS